MQSLRKYLLISILLSGVFNIQVYGQGYSEEECIGFEDGLLWNKQQVEYRLPPGFRLWMITGLNPNIPSYSEAMHSIDGKFMIVFELYSPLSELALRIADHYRPNYSKRNQDSMYLDHVITDMELSLGNKFKSLEKSPIKYYSPKEAKKKFNADCALSYHLVIGEEKHVVREEKEYCKVYVLQKNERGYIRMLCYYKKMSRRQLNKYLKLAENVFHFRDPENFMPYVEEEEIPIILNKKKETKNEQGEIK